MSGTTRRDDDATTAGGARAMDDAAAEERRLGGEGHPGGPLLVYVLVAGIVYWAIHIAGMPALTPYVCRSGEHWWLHVLTAATALPTAHALAPSWRFARRGVGIGGVRFLGAMAVLLNGVSLLAIVVEWVPVFFLDPCA